ncbi:MAG: hypothetical protein KC983_01555 [Phycisphaerales bacterium]|nr:hypothetical protein [Phycisphaerales bacterium]
MTFEDPDDLVTIITTETEFEAETLALVLRDAGIEAVTFGNSFSALPVQQHWNRVPLQVRRRDAERAKARLTVVKQESIDIDWDSVDIGEREDRHPLTPIGHVPYLAKIGLVIGIVIMLLAAIVAGWVIFAQPAPPKITG